MYKEYIMDSHSWVYCKTRQHVVLSHCIPLLTVYLQGIFPLTSVYSQIAGSLFYLICIAGAFEFALYCYVKLFLKIFPDVWIYNYVFQGRISLYFYTFFFLVLGIGKIPEMFFILHKKKVIRWEEFFVYKYGCRFLIWKKTIYGTYHRLDIYVHVLCKVMSELGFWFKCLLQGHTVQIKDFKTTKAIIFGYK